MFTMCQNAMIREEQEKLDMATLLLYRLLEMIEQKRLAGYNLYVSKMNYKEIKVNTQIHPEGWYRCERTLQTDKRKISGYENPVVWKNRKYLYAGTDIIVGRVHFIGSS